MRQRLRLEIEIDPAGSIVGNIRSPGRREREFAGWLDLLAALEDACAAARPTGPACQDQGRGSTLT